MPTLELLIDASPLQRGAQQAESALRNVTTQAERTATTVRSVGPSLSGAFQVGGGSVQIAQGIAQTATAFGQLNTQAAAFSAARTALELGNTIRDFQQFRGAVGGVSTVFGTLGAVIRANPIGAIATAIGLAATAMGLFGSSTRDATDEVKRQSTELDGLLSKLPNIEARARVFGPGEVSSPEATRTTVSALATEPANSRLNIRDVARLLGQSEEDFRFALARNPQFGDGALALNQNNPLREFGRPSYAVNVIGPADAAIAGREVLADRQLGQIGAGLRASEMQAEFNARNQAEEQARERQQQAAERIRESMERAAQFGEQIGASVGDAAAQLLFAGSSLRSVVAGLVRQFATQGLQSAGAGIFGAITRGVAGATQTQNQGNVGTGEMVPRG